MKDHKLLFFASQRSDQVNAGSMMISRRKFESSELKLRTEDRFFLSCIAEICNQKCLKEFNFSYWICFLDGLLKFYFASEMNSISKCIKTAI